MGLFGALTGASGRMNGGMNGGGGKAAAMQRAQSQPRPQPQMNGMAGRAAQMQPQGIGPSQQMMGQIGNVRKSLVDPNDPNHAAAMEGLAGGNTAQKYFDEMDQADGGANRRMNKMMGGMGPNPGQVTNPQMSGGSYPAPPNQMPSPQFGRPGGMNRLPMMNPQMQGQQGGIGPSFGGGQFNGGPMRRPMMGR